MVSGSDLLTGKETTANHSCLEVIWKTPVATGPCCAKDHVNTLAANNHRTKPMSW